MMGWLRTLDSSDFLTGRKEAKYFGVMQNSCHTNLALNMYFVETFKGNLYL